MCSSFKTVSPPHAPTNFQIEDPGRRPFCREGSEKLVDWSYTSSVSLMYITDVSGRSCAALKPAALVAWEQD